MSDYEDGSSGQVEGQKYCMKGSFQAKNVDSMNKAMGYENPSDLANTPKAPTSMMGEKQNRQMGPKMPGENSYNYDKKR